MQDYERLGVFYLGKVYDLAERKRRDELLLYDSRDLTTHAVCAGMTGSGKTGLCLSLLEEAAIDGVPAIAIDPKGDLGNLLLTFPGLEPQDFRPWIDEGAAARAGVSPDEFAAQAAKTWREGLAEWGQEPARIARFRESVEVALYTPGSTAGLPLTVLRSFAAGPQAVRDDPETFRQRITTSASGLLGLLGMDADPVRSREHILISALLEHAWRQGQDVDIGGLIQLIQQPPLDRVGVLELDTFFPPRDRLGLALALNNLLASPAFAGWTEGEPLEVERLLYTPAGKPRLSILSIAHLSDAERMFFVSVFLDEVIAWMRGQAGTSSLRAILYMDEVFGYFPPTANPPSKLPMLTLLKQARAYGLGIVLATQNPADLDYKGLANAGTWFLGRLQTERDKLRVLDGLEGAAAQTGSSFSRQKMESMLAALGKRIFLMNNVHEDAPVVFETRWALSYLRGPLTRTHIQELTKDRKKQAPMPEETAVETLQKASSAPIVSERRAERPVLPADLPQKFLAASGDAPAGEIVYRPALYALSTLHFVRAGYHTDVWEDRAFLAFLADGKRRAAWHDLRQVDADALEFADEPVESAQFAALAVEMTRPGIGESLARSLKEALYRSESVTVWKCGLLRAYSAPGEEEGHFRARLAQVARERRDQQVDKLRQRYASKLGTLKRQIEAARARIDREKAQAGQAAFDTAISFGSSLIGALFGRKLASRTNVGRAATSVRSAGRAMRQRGDVAEAEAKLRRLEEELQLLKEKLEDEIEEIDAAMHADAFELEKLEVSPRKSDICVKDLALVWTPWRVGEGGTVIPAWAEAARERPGIMPGASA